jgi:hypothetical protein
MVMGVLMLCQLLLPLGMGARVELRVVHQLLHLVDLILEMGLLVWECRSLVYWPSGWEVYWGSWLFCNLVQMDN